MTESLQGVADETGLCARSVRNWARKGEQLESGLFHDIAVALNASKQRRGLGNKPLSAEPPSGRPENVVAQFPSSSEQATAGDGQSVDVRIMPPATTDCLIPWEGDTLTRETLDLTAVRVAMAAMAPVERAGETSPTTSISYQVHRVQIGNEESPPELSTLEFENLRCQCHVRQFEDTDHIVRLVRLWPRDMSKLTLKQKHIVEKGLRVLVSDCDHDFFEVHFTTAPWLVVPRKGRNE